jgi:hypothetical protein
MATAVAGGCLCGAVRYECAAEPLMAGTCHCLDCQKSSGAGSAPTLFVPRAALQITAEVKYYASKGGQWAKRRTRLLSQLRLAFVWQTCGHA